MGKREPEEKQPAVTVVVQDQPVVTKVTTSTPMHGGYLFLDATLVGGEGDKSTLIWNDQAKLNPPPPTRIELSREELDVTIELLVKHRLALDTAMIERS